MLIPQITGDGPIHRLPPLAKLLALFAVSVLLFTLSSSSALAWPAGMIVAATLLWCRSGLMHWLRAWPVLLPIAALCLWTAFARGPEAATVTLLRLGSLSLMATVVTVTTTVGQFVETITRLAGPLEKLGLANARDIGLAIGLVIRFVPEVHAHYRNLVDAHHARGLTLRPSTTIVPLIIATMLDADAIANAIDARNIRAPSGRRN